MIRIAIGFALVGVLFWLGLGVRRIGAVSLGKPIDARDGKALVLIDLQTVFWEDGPYDAAQKSAAQDAILAEVAAARAAGHPIIALRQEWSRPVTKVLARLTMKGQAIAGSAGTEIAAPFAGFADYEIVKRVQDGFETGALDDLLARLGVGRLRLVGLDLNYCVLKTALAARARGYGVTVAAAGALSAGPRARAEASLRAAGVALA